MFNMLQKKHELVVPLKGLSPIKLKCNRVGKIAVSWCNIICFQYTGPQQKDLQNKAKATLNVLRNFGVILVLVPFQCWCHFSFGDISV